MKWTILTLVALMGAMGTVDAQTRYPIMVDTNGALLSPTNFWRANSTNISALGIGGSSSNANVILVDSLAGNDATGQRGTGKAFQSLAAALSNVVNGSVVQLLPGTHYTACTGQNTNAQQWRAINNLESVTNVTLLGYGATVMATNYGMMLTFSNCNNLNFYGTRFVGSWDSGSNSTRYSTAGCLAANGWNNLVTVKDCRFEEWPDQVVTCCIWAQRKTTGLRVDSCYFKHIGTTNMMFPDGLLYADGACISGLIGGNCQVLNNIAEDRICRFFEYEDDGGAVAGDCTNIVVMGNVVSDILNWGILVTAYRDHFIPHNVTIAHNELTYSPSIIPNGRAGAIVVDSATDVMIHGNTINNWQGWGNSGYGAIMVQGVRNAVIDDNVLDHCNPVNIAAGAEIASAGPSGEVIIRNNLMINSGGRGIICGATNIIAIGNRMIGVCDYGTFFALASSTNSDSLCQGWCTNFIATDNTLAGTNGTGSVMFYAVGNRNMAMSFNNNRNETAAPVYTFTTPYTFDFSGVQVAQGSGVTVTPSISGPNKIYTVSASGGGFIPTNTDGTIIITALNGSITNIELANTNMFFFGDKANGITNGATITNGVLRVASMNGFWQFFPDGNTSGSNCAASWTDSAGNTRLVIGTNGAVQTGVTPNVSGGSLVSACPQGYQSTNLYLVNSAGGALGVNLSKAPGVNYGTLQLWNPGNYSSNCSIVFGSRYPSQVSSTNAMITANWPTANLTNPAISFTDAIGGTNINVGIRTNSPQAALHVAGPARVDGWVCLGNTNLVPPVVGSTTSNLAYFYTSTSGSASNSALIKAMNGSGTVTTISPHDTDGPPQIYDVDAPYQPEILHNLFTGTGLHEWANMTRLLNQWEQFKKQQGLDWPPVIMTETAADYCARTGSDPVEIKQVIDSALDQQESADVLGLDYELPEFVRVRLDQQSQIIAHPKSPSPSPRLAP